MKKRNFEELRKSMSLKEFNKFCKKVTEEYANSEPQFARTYFCETYRITISCFYKILEYAVVENLVDDIVVQRMIKKAMTNQNAHKNGAGYSSIIKYTRMYQKRKRNIAIAPYKKIAREMSVETVRTIAVDFGDNPDITKKEFASAYGVHTKVIDFCLERAIEDNIADDKTVVAIEKRSIKNAKAENIEITKRYFSNLRKRRKANKKEITLQ